MRCECVVNGHSDSVGSSSHHQICDVELMNLLHGNRFSPWEDFFINPFGSDVISPNQLCKCTCMYRCWSKHMQWNNEVE